METGARIRAVMMALAGLVAAAAPWQTAHAEGDAAAGEQVFRRCAVCHTVENGGANKVGPNLWGVVGSVAGSRDNGFRYSAALVGAEVTWTDDALDMYLTNPRSFIPGNRMAFPGLRSADDRANIIAFLKASTQ